MHALTGSWIANVDRSRRDPNHQFHRATIRFDVAGSAVSLTYGGVNASGRDEQGALTMIADGQERPIPEAPGMVSASTLEPRVLHTIGKLNGTVMGRAAYEVAEDGTTMTATISGVDAAGKSFEQVVVFEREEAVRDTRDPIT
jgi:hypothetical protein